MTAKGIKRGYVKKKLRHEHYLRTIKHKITKRAQFQTIRTLNHTIRTIVNDKICLSAYDDKRFILDCGVETYAYGHYKIRQSRSL